MKLLQKLGRISVLMAMLCLTAGTLIGCAEKEDTDTVSSGSAEAGGVETP